ncbi:MAG: hypothetical protein LIO87_08745 [Eubacterium sp.]|nr:hypothetical protein [Eubacterium sp.]
MPRQRNTKTFMCDFETTVYDGQKDTEVWASACVELYTEDVHIFHSIGETFDYFKEQKTNVVAYYHNLKFDGSFWLYYLIHDLKYAQAYSQTDDRKDTTEWLDDKDMPNNSFKYVISDMGMWYTIKIRTGRKYIELRDSLKLLPFSVKRIGESFKTKHKKLDMEYKGFRYAGCPITEEEQKYIANDVLVVKEALEFMFDEGHNKLKIGSCCMSEFKHFYGKEDYKIFFPDVYAMDIDSDLYTYPTAGDYIRQSYKGGWCYLVKGKENKIYRNGTTADVNSLYPSMMSSESGNRYPVGEPKFWHGNFIPEDVFNNDRYYYFVRIKTRFQIKDNYLPFIQIKNSYSYNATEMLETSDYYDPDEDRYKEGTLILTLTCTDYILFREHYNVFNFEILDGCYFASEIGLFDCYIEKYKKLKLESKGAMRELAKLFLNNLYGKMASSRNSSFKVAELNEEEALTYFQVEEYNKKAGYIPIGSAITSYARNFTIRAAQKNYHGKDKPGFIYADTDSIHCDLQPLDIVGVPVHDKNFCCWKLESSWDMAIFVRQKTYIEHVVAEDLKVIDNPYNNIKCAGMPQKCKDLFQLSMDGYEYDENDSYTPQEREFLSTKRTMEDFKIGLCVPGKLLPKRIKGGTLLVETTYRMR